MRKKIYFTAVFLLLAAFNASSANLNCLRCNQREIALPEMQELKPSRLSKAFIGVFFYKADKPSTEVNDKKAGTSDSQEQTKKEKELRILFFTKTGKPVEGDNIYTLTAKLNIGAGELKQHPDKADILFENKSVHLSDTDREDFRKGSIEITYINDLEQILSKETNTRKQIKKLLLIEDKVFTGIGKAGPHTEWKLNNLGIYLKLTNSESKFMKETVEYLIANRKKQYAAGQIPGTSTETDTGASTSKEDMTVNE